MGASVSLYFTLYLRLTSNQVDHTKKSTKEQLKDLLVQRLDRMLNFGTTVVEAKSGYGLERETEMKMLEVKVTRTSDYFRFFMKLIKHIQLTFFLLFLELILFQKDQRQHWLQKISLTIKFLLWWYVQNWHLC